MSHHHFLILRLYNKALRKLMFLRCNYHITKTNQYISFVFYPSMSYKYMCAHVDI